jgi:hypothetical protein
VVVANFESVGRIGIDSLDLLIGSLPQLAPLVTLSRVGIVFVVLHSPGFKLTVFLGELDCLGEDKDGTRGNVAFHKKVIIMILIHIEGFKL